MTAGNTVVFIGPVGIWGQDGLTTHCAEKLLGHSFRIDHEANVVNAQCTELWPEVKGETYGAPDSVKVKSIFLPDGISDDKVLSRFKSSNAPAAYYETRDGCNILWTAVPRLKPSMLRALAVRAGVPVVSVSNDPVYAGRGFVGIHAASDGRKSLKLIGKGTPREIFSNKTWPAGTEQVELELKRGETRIFVVG